MHSQLCVIPHTVWSHHVTLGVLTYGCGWVFNRWREIFEEHFDTQARRSSWARARAFLNCALVFGAVTFCGKRGGFGAAFLRCADVVAGAALWTR